MTRRADAGPGKAAAALGRRAAGGLLLLLTLVPVYRVLDPSVTGTAGAYVVEQLDTATSLVWSATMLALIPFVLLMIAGPGLPVGRWLQELAASLVRPGTVAFAGVVALVGAAVAALFGLLVLEGKPNLIDAMAQLVHARYLAAGAGAGPTELAEFYVFPNTVLTERGWVSQYPPGHAALLALGLRLGAAWLVGPVLLGVALFFTALVAEQLLPTRIVAVRVVLAMLAVSPFMAAHAGAYMNHTSAAAFIAIAVWLVLRARERVLWALAAGAAASIAVAIRPLSSFVMICAVGGVVWGARALEERRVGPLARRVALAVAGALPVTTLHLWHNARYFGAPFSFGYSAAYGPSHDLGFHQDPWGNRYGPLEALGYTSSDLTLLSSALFETPLPLLAFVGAFLVLAPRLEAGERVVFAWAGSAVLANFFYWHHGVFMGPRMLNEAAPAWALLFAAALDWTVRTVPAAVPAARPRYAVRGALVATLALVALVSLVYMAPRRMMSWGGDYFASMRIEPPRPPEPAVVFVHGPWISRVGSRLVADGVRLDSLETIIRQNSTCAVQHYADARRARANGALVAVPSLDVVPRADRLPASIEISPANFIRAWPDESLSARCAVEVRADRRGVVELAPFLWQGALPGIDESGVLYVRDLGPAANRAMLAHVPQRAPWVFTSRAPDAAPELLAYDEGMTLIWGAARP